MNKQCEGIVHRPRHLGLVDECSKRGRYLTPTGIFVCAFHLKKIGAFSSNPIDTDTGNEIDRHTLYYSGLIKPIMKDIADNIAIEP